MNSVTEFNNRMARTLMLSMAMLQDDLDNFQGLKRIENGLPLTLTPFHSEVYNEVLAAKQSLERAHQLLVTGSITDSPINFLVGDARINELEMWRGNRPCAG